MIHFSFTEEVNLVIANTAQHDSNILLDASKALQEMTWLRYALDEIINHCSESATKEQTTNLLGQTSCREKY